MPLHPTTTHALRRYVQRRDRDPLTAAITAFFVFDYGRLASTSSLEYAFQLLRRRLKWRARGGHPAPRIHDLRHTFAVKTLLRWYRTGANVEHRLPELATYLGHTHVNDTYWYLSAIPQLLQLAVARLDTTKGDELS